jgi:uncharacterized protein YceH (UPF0502 family)
MIELTADEARVIGVLIEKGQTTPESYPLTLNAIVAGANQKNNRDPVLEMDENAARSAVIGLRNKGLVVQLDGPGQRVPKFRHQFKEKAGVNTPEMVLLAELLLRGPQTLGELRGRASRMHPLESLEMVRGTLDQLMGKAEPLVKRVAPAPGSRAERYAQWLCPDLHEVVEGVESEDVEGEPSEVSLPRAGGGAPGVADRVAKLEAEVATLRAALVKLAGEIGVANPFENAAEAAATTEAGEGGHAS